MNRELDNLGQILDNLPEELQYIGIIKDNKSGEFIFFDRNILDSSFVPELKAIRRNIESDFVINRFILDLVGSIDEEPLLQQLEQAIKFRRKEILGYE